MSVELLLIAAIIAIGILFFLNSLKIKKKFDASSSRRKWESDAYTSRSKKRNVVKASLVKQDRGFQEAIVDRVIDGDTVDILKSFRKIRIRLDSIDCPEHGQHWGDTARFGLIKLIGGPGSPTRRTWPGPVSKDTGYHLCSAWK